MHTLPLPYIDSEDTLRGDRFVFIEPTTTGPVGNPTQGDPGPGDPDTSDPITGEHNAGYPL